MIDTIYKEEILEHYRNPLNFGKPAQFTISSMQTNPFCGDEIEVFIKYTGDTAQDIGFIGKGCAISMASASILTEHIKGKKKKELTKFSEEDMLSLLGIEVSETRKKCAMLALFTLRDCIVSI